MPATSVTDLTVSIVSHGHGSLITGLIADLAASPAPRPRVILTLNIAEDDLDLGDVAGLEITRIVNASPKGFGANHNTAFALSTSRWFAILNPDIRLPMPPFAPLIAAADTSFALVAPRIVAPDGHDEDAVRTNLTPLSLAARHLRGKHSADGGAFRWLAGMFMLVRADAFAAVGGFDRRFFLYCEDFDLCARLVLAGYRLMLVRDVAVIHDARRDSRRSLRHLRWHVASLAKVWTSRTFAALTWRIWLDPNAFALEVQDTAAADRA